MKCAKNNGNLRSNRPITRTGASGHRYIRYGQRVPSNSITIFCIYNDVITHAGISVYAVCAYYVYFKYVSSFDLGYVTERR
ncbi:Uncharacterized protein FWK35_00020154 [Aphis craccivora]|uniref:Uncharacterized protein n=1 Tax=Aphis craccivora TaxID=307492 RepID=A0A6G0Z6S2_APHCR|nr:Uncharacterized protein FWK35_00020154 [Aphis craccivora]